MPANRSHRRGGLLDGTARDRARAMRREPTDAERALWNRLRGSRLGGMKFRRQVPLFGFIADFCCIEQRIVIELDGGQHADSQYDAWRAEVLRSKGFRVVRFWNNDVLTNAEGVLEEILRVAEKRAAPSPQPSPASRSGRGS